MTEIYNNNNNNKPHIDWDSDHQYKYVLLIQLLKQLTHDNSNKNWSIWYDLIQFDLIRYDMITIYDVNDALWLTKVRFFWLNFVFVVVLFCFT